MSKKVITLPHLEPWQMDVYRDVAVSGGSGRIFVVKSKRQVGKSILAVCLLIKFCLEKKCISVCVEPTQAQSRRVFKQMCDFLDGSGAITSANSTLLIITFANGSEMLFKSAEQRENLRGFSVSGLLVIDEGSFIQSSIYEILYATCDATNSPILVISTPLFCSGEFYELYMRGLDGTGRVKSYDWSKYDTSIFLNPEKLEYYRSTMSPLKFRSEYLGEFIVEGSYIFGDITKCIKGYSTKPSVYGGIDWGAGNGNDYTTFILMDEDGAVTKIWCTKDMDSVRQVDEISMIINSEPHLKSVMVEMNSIGKVFFDNLKGKANKPIKGFYTTNDSKRTIIEQLVTAFLTGAISIPGDDELIRELQHYNVEKTKNGYTYNGADNIHDDFVMSLAICYDNFKKGYTSGRITLV